MPYAYMKQYRQWLLWKLDGKIKKPVSPHTGRVCDSTDPANHVSYDEAVAAMVLLPGTQLAFAVTAGDPLFFGDLDSCLQDDGTWSPVALHYLSLVPGALVEVSQSGRGLHVIGVMANRIQHACKNTPHKLELYTSGRFIALGDMPSATGDSGHVVDLQPLVNAYFQPGAGKVEVEWSSGPCEGSNPIPEDQDLVEKAMNSKSAGNAFGNKASFKDLWTGNVEALARAYPTQNDADAYDMSGADGGLAFHLAFWTGRDCDRIERLMGQSALGLRDKWTSREDYRRATISSACGKNQQTYGTPKAEGPVEMPTQRVLEPIRMPACNVVGDGAFEEFFAPYIYLEGPHVMLDKRTGRQIGPRSFKARLGGYEFTMGPEARPTTDAFKAFTETTGFRMPRVQDIQFRPDLPVGSIVIEGKEDYINSYVPNDDVIPRPGDVTRFLGHIGRMLPNGDDAKILICFMASLLQNPGVKFQWAPVLVGAQGCGKTLIADMIGEIAGHQYTRRPQATDIASKFNAWVEGCLFAIIEELDVKGNKETLDAIKTLLTNIRMDTQGKGKESKPTMNFANFMILTNEINGVPINEDSRRFCTLVATQMTAEDLRRDFQEPNYFGKFAKWTMDPVNIAAVADFLLNMQIDPAFDPAGECNRAPRSSATDEVIEASRGIVEQEIDEAIANQDQGFKGGWISGKKLKDLIKDMRPARTISDQRRATMVRDLGYIKHPALKDKGRPNVRIIAENARPVLYLKKGHIALNLQTAAEVVSAYITAQKYAQFGEEKDERN